MAEKRSGKKAGAKKAKAKKVGAVKPKAADEQALRAFVRARAEDFLNDPNITSVGIGLKNGDGEICLQFTVGQKGESAIESLGSNRIPETIEVDGKTFSTDVLERSYKPSYKLVDAEQLNQRRQRVDPLVPGVSVAHRSGSAGTLGLVVFDRSTGAPCILSNWHVLNGNGGRIGDVVVQPGPYDDNSINQNAAGILLRSHLGAAGDCALARILHRDFERAVLDVGTTPKRMARVSLGDKVIKSGRTTAVTRGRVRRIDVMVRIDYGPPTGAQPIGCFEIGPDPDHIPGNGEISMGGDSGSAWLIHGDNGPTDIFAGLHFAGEVGDADEHALACYPLSVQKKLDFVLEPPVSTATVHPDMESVVARTGYDPQFLGVPVPEPELSRAQRRDALEFDGRRTIPYTHFSVCLSKSRRMARYAAWNIDGSRRVIVGSKSFKLDPRIDDRYQIGEDLYSRNPVDRGHVARRAELCWGPVPEARQANADSFYFTNIAPQHERFNRSSYGGLWGKLENLVFEQADVQDLRISVIGGPVLREDDIEYRGVQIPDAFWKVIAYVGTDGVLRCSAFVLSQTDLLNRLEALDLSEFHLYQLSLNELAGMTGLGFAELYGADTKANPELATPLRDIEAVGQAEPTMLEIRSASDILI
ncbi:DNA/RNA non-specific endonuclease [Hwanghaeella grinnelliae]|uniref:DNA/RNA non-specific endonuclease n=1 Tax=Hwanghaeella grinnelliae TaxID=2500179 RepID=A0A437QX28_9PROT|nr:DNA/RNA non-specific endonuclease [Hwanghaeella grinnelliae]RVU39090.1 DNA/RNA non-specific endonuclease [Hwanghaeella grinnelliae]